MPGTSRNAFPIVLTALTIACSGGGGTGTPPPPNNTTTVASVLVTPASRSIVQGQTASLTAQALTSGGIAIAGKTFTWSSGNAAVATVANGLVTAVAAGTALISASVDGISGSSTITVTALPITSLTLTPPTLSLVIGQTSPLTATLYSGTTVLTGRTVTFTSLNTNIATVSSSGVVTAVNTGSVTIRATIDNFLAQTVVTVTYAQAVFSQITAGDFHTCALDAVGNAFCWGSNQQGQAGTGATDPRVPTPVAGGLRFSFISAGNSHTCGVAFGGAAYCWGMGIYGQLGDGAKLQRNTPVAVAGGLTFQSISGGNHFTCGLTTNGAAYCWGQGGLGQLGDGAKVDRVTPSAVAGGFSFTSVSASETGACGLTVGQRGFCWGASPSHGDGTSLDRASPVEVAGGRLYKYLLAGGRGGCAITTNDASWCWGLQGLIAGVTDNRTPWQLPSAITFSRLVVAQRSTCGISTTLAAYCWGENIEGQIGDSTRVQMRDTPTRVYGQRSYNRIAVGGWHACGLEPDGRAWCWGSNDSWELGTGIQYQGQGLMPVPVRTP